jgi:hypothetical protein
MTNFFTRIYRIGAPVAILLLTSLACSVGAATPVSQTNAPSVNVASPLAGQILPVGQPVSVSSTSTSPDGIQRVELWVDNTLLRVDNNPSQASPYIVTQTWQSETPGTHAIVVKAIDVNGTVSEAPPTTIMLEAQSEATPGWTEIATESPEPSREPSPTPLAPSQTPSRPPASATSSPTPQPPTATAEDTPVVMCTPPACATGEVYYCQGDCPGGCGTECATPTPTLTPPSFEATGIEVQQISQPTWEKPGVGDYLGYPTQPASDDRRYARQYFERGYLYWWDRPDGRGLIWVVEIPQPGANQGTHWTGPYEDTWDGDDRFSCQAARATSAGPVAGFGKLWCERPEIAQAIGIPIELEQGTGESTSYGVVQFFQNGVMLYSPLDHEVFVLFNSGGWRRYSP